MTMRGGGGGIFFFFFKVLESESGFSWAEKTVFEVEDLVEFRDSVSGHWLVGRISAVNRDVVQLSPNGARWVETQRSLVLAQY